MKHLTMRIAIVSLLAALGCQKQQAPTVHVTEPHPPVRSMASLKPAPAKTPAETLEPAVAAPATQPALAAKAPQPKPTAEPVRTYTIRKSDTLWSIAKRRLGSGRRWKEIVAVNPGLDPTKLQPGQTIKLPPE